FEVIQRLLQANVHVYVDKPLTEQIVQSEQLIELAHQQQRTPPLRFFVVDALIQSIVQIELAHQQQRTLMVGFNRRFSPFYVALKQNTQHFSSIR
ncbi:Gfo/Idh/MocA family oxidoreductase, partial [Providencia stuartii]|uniref:Gfo/Idh/MocA family oxidoreductase n=1 Tax=Providencia stuartii TaxID=588 RepID=UPI001EBDC273|nr:hypothetical protein [Providencia stuartii]